MDQTSIELYPFEPLEPTSSSLFPLPDLFGVSATETNPVVGAYPLRGPDLTLSLWSQTTPAPHQSPWTEAETLPDEKGRIYRVSHPELSVYLPGDRTQPTPGVVICPGGSYHYVATEKEGHVFARYLAAQGIAGFVLKYRTPGGTPFLPFEDAERAMELVGQHVQEWNLMGDKIGIMGFSAGGHLAAMCSTCGVHKPAFTVLYYPLVSMQADATHTPSCDNLIGGRDELRDRYSAERWVDERTPPALLFSTKDDFGVSILNTHTYYDALVERGIAAQLEVYATGGHGWGFSLRMADHQKMKKTLITWIKAQ